MRDPNLNLHRDDPASLESRSRMVSFRLSTEEYDRFRDLCYANGTRSVSEMARAGIRLMLQQSTGGSSDALESRVTDLESRLQMLTLEIKRINRQLAIAAPRTTTLSLTAAE